MSQASVPQSHTKLASNLQAQHKDFDEADEHAEIQVDMERETRVETQCAMRKWIGKKEEAEDNQGKKQTFLQRCWEV